MYYRHRTSHVLTNADTMYDKVLWQAFELDIWGLHVLMLDWISKSDHTC